MTDTKRNNKMNDYEAFKWIVDHFKDMPKDFSSPSKWAELERATTRYKQVYANSSYIDLLERYYYSLYDIASIDYIINNKGGLPECLLMKNTNNM